MRKGIQKIYSAILVIFICLPWFFWLIFGKYADSSNYENRALASRPKFHIKNCENYPAEWEAFFNDRIPFRNELISFNSWVNYRLFKTSVNENVILGKDKWLFYDAVTDGNPIGDYEGNLDFSPEEIEIMGDGVFNVQDRLDKMGIRLAVFIPPNKERVYQQYMPARYTCSETSRSDRMIGRLAKQGADIISPKDDLVKLGSEYQLYYPYDTHWNQLGAYVGTCSVLKSWGMDTDHLSQLAITESERKGDDLANMLNLGEAVFNDSTEYVIQGDFDHETPITDQLAHYENPNARYDKTVFLLGDSYRTAMKPALCMYFTDVYVAEHDNYTYEMLKETSPDYMIVEYIERHSDRLADIEELVFGHNAGAGDGRKIGEP